MFLCIDSRIVAIAECFILPQTHHQDKEDCIIAMNSMPPLGQITRRVGERLLDHMFAE